MVRLRAWKEADLQAITEMRNDVSLQAQLLSRVRGSDEAQVRQWLEVRSAPPDNLLFIVAGRDNDEAYGYLQFTGMDPVDRRADLGICLNPKIQSKGMGGETLNLALPYMRDIWGLRKVSLRVRADNEKAIRCYTKVGFKQCGLLAQHTFIDGVWNDVILMDLIWPVRKGA